MPPLFKSLRRHCTAQSADRHYPRRSVGGSWVMLLFVPRSRLLAITIHPQLLQQPSIPPQPANTTFLLSNFTRQASQSRPRPICTSWNGGRRTYPGNCIFRHICITCGQWDQVRDCKDTTHNFPSSVGILAQDHQQGVDIVYPVDCLNQWFFCYTKLGVVCCPVLVVVLFCLLLICDWIGLLAGASEPARQARQPPDQYSGEILLRFCYSSERAI